MGRKIKKNPRFSEGNLSNYSGYFLLFLLACFFAMGGSSNASVTSLMFIRPLGAFAFCLGLALLTKDAFRIYWPILVFAGLWLLVVALQLVPLPAVMWEGLAGRSLLAEIANTTGFAYPLHSISMFPSLTQNSFFALLLPFSVMLFFVTSNEKYQKWAFAAILIFGALSGLIAIAQISGSASGPLYFFETTKLGGAVGLFANRNHQAALLACMPPLLVCHAFIGKQKYSFVPALTLFAWLIFAILVFVTGSRTGLILFLASSLASFFILPKEVIAKIGLVRKFGPWVLYAIAAAVAVFSSLLVFAADKTLAWERMVGSDAAEDARFDFYSVGWTIIKDTFPFGAGGGTFAPVFRIYEPDSIATNLLVNRLHSDVQEVIFEYGLAGAIMLALAFALLIYLGHAAWQKAENLSNCLRMRASFISLLVLLGASFTDYPLRTPALACVAIVMGLIILHGYTSVVLPKNSIQKSKGSK